MSSKKVFDFVVVLFILSASINDNLGNTLFVCIGELFTEFVCFGIDFYLMPLVLELSCELKDGFFIVFKVEDEGISYGFLFTWEATKDFAEYSTDPYTSSHSAIVLSFGINIASQVLIPSSSTNRASLRFLGKACFKNCPCIVVQSSDNFHVYASLKRTIKCSL